MRPRLSMTAICDENAFEFVFMLEQGLKPRVICARCGTTEQLAEKVRQGAEESLRG
jgi:hypothetical protein